MRKQLVHSIILSLCFFLLTSCAPSPEVIGTQTSMSSSSTAAAWTQTLTPTKTPTQTPTITPTVTPSPSATPKPTITPQGGSNQLLIVGRLGGFKGVPSIYLHDFNTGTSKVLLENHDIAGVSPDEKHLLVYVKNWKASLMGPIAGELYLTTLDGAEPILISSNYLTNGQTDWIDNDTFTYTDMKAGNFKYYEYKVSSASVKELPEPIIWNNPNYDTGSEMFKSYIPGECQTNNVGSMYDRTSTTDCMSIDGKYIWRVYHYSKPNEPQGGLILNPDGSVHDELALKDVFPDSKYFQLRGIWSPNSKYLLLAGDTNFAREVAFLRIKDASIEKIDFSENLPEFSRGVSFSEESFSPDGNRFLFWFNGLGSEGINVTLLYDFSTGKLNPFQLNLPERTYLDWIHWFHH